MTEDNTVDTGQSRKLSPEERSDEHFTLTEPAYRDLLDERYLDNES